MLQTIRTRPFWHWVLMAAVTITLTLATWFLAPLLTIGGHSVLADPLVRLCVTLIVFLIVVVVLILWFRPGAAPKSEETASEAENDARARIESLDRGLKRAMEILRTMDRSRSRTYRYTLPWYLVVGPERSGKSSLIRMSGLRFPLGDKRGGQVSAGVGYVLSFADKAVIVDTPGLVESHLERRVWRSFLGLIRRYRPRQPLNGLILTIDALELRRSAEFQSLPMHTELRRYLVDIQSRLHVRLPVYVVLTKADEIPGFPEFFANALPAERDGVFGVTLPLLDEKGLTAEGEDAAKVFSREYDAFLQWQLPRVLDRAGSPGEVSPRFKSFMFLPHMGALKSRLQEFIEDVFQPNEFEHPLLLRGVYFTSADGGVIDGEEAEGGMSTPMEPSGNTRNRGMFIRDMLEKVVFAEAGLVSRDKHSRRAEWWARWGIAGLVTAAVAVLVILGALNIVRVHYIVDDVRQDAARIKAEFGGAIIRISEPEQSDMAVVLPALQALAALPTGWDERNKPEPFQLFGSKSMYHQLSRATRGAYATSLRRIFLPILDADLEKQIQDNMNVPRELYGALMSYLMLGNVAPIDRDVIVARMSNYWRNMYPGPMYASRREALVQQLDNLINVGFPAMELDQGLVSRARDVLEAFPPAQRGMELLRALPEIRDLPPWRLTDIAGPLVPHAFVRRSGRSLSEGIPGMYRADAFSTTVLPAISKLADRVAAEEWVRFANPGVDWEMEKDAADMAQQMIALYVNDYTTAWENMLNDVTIAPFTSFQKELSILQSLLGPPSPLAAYLQSAARETAVYPPSATDAQAALADAHGAAAAPNPAPQRDPSFPGNAITDHFEPLRQLVSGSPSALDQLVSSLSQLRALIGPLAAVGDAGASQVVNVTGNPAFAQILNQLQLETTGAPQALAESVADLARNTSGVANAGVNVDINAAWKAQVLPFCQAAINERYPFSVSSNEVTIADFSKMFGPDGLMQQFFDKQLKPFVDTGSNPWKLHGNSVARPDLARGALLYFQQAAAIQKAFFGSGMSPQIAFTVTPVDLDPGAMSVTLTIDDQSLTYQYGPTQTVPMQWPGAKGGVRVAFGATQPGRPSSVSMDGPWALFRFLDSRTLKPVGGSRYELGVNIDARSASFSIEAASVYNPFQDNVLAGFRCAPFLVGQ